jgi:hypothetical protein
MARSQVPIPQENTDPERRITDAFVEGDKLIYNGYVIQKRYKKVKLDYPSKMNEPPPQWTEVSYAVLKRHGKTLMKFDGVYAGYGNNTQFGLFSFLGGDRKQLVVSQDISRGGNQWVISLDPTFRVIYDGRWFATGREGEDLGVIDLDKDGVYEIAAPITAFYGFSEWLPTGLTPLPSTVFKYDRKARKYLPANTLFQGYLLANIDTEKRNISPPTDRNYHLANILTIVLDYIYAGREQEAWTFYDESYKLSDKKELKAKIQAVLIKQPVYRFIYQRTSAR